ncbi:MAG: DUF5677 domain-containing protein [Erysipelotrichaceae bacterium]|nr:DUF5677 domain-containing protein [Erysipelotrichaceae bacterium]
MSENKQTTMITQISENLFEVFWSTYSNSINLNKEFIKKVFLAVDLKYKKRIADSSVTDALLKNVGVFDMVFYICAEHRFHLQLVKDEYKNQIEQDEKYFQQLVNVVYDKLIINEFRSVDSKSVISKYSVEISLLTMFINRLFVLLGQCKINPKSSKQKLQIDIFAKCFMLIKSTLNQLVDGLETEAMSSWRTFHELLCVLCVITKGDEKVAQAYFRHLTYGAYNRGEISDEKEIEIITKQMEEDMVALAVKKANKEKFINYGWIHWAFKTYKDEEVKMNFLGGLQKVADLTSYKKYYEIASDVTHSTPLLVYADKMKLTTTTLKITYEHFFIIETMFTTFCMNDLNMNVEENKALYDYLLFKKTYKPKVEIVYQQIDYRYRATINKNK